MSEEQGEHKHSKPCFWPSLCKIPGCQVCVHGLCELRPPHTAWQSSCSRSLHVTLNLPCRFLLCEELLQLQLVKLNPPYPRHSQERCEQFKLTSAGFKGVLTLNMWKCEGLKGGSTALFLASWVSLRAAPWTQEKEESFDLQKGGNVNPERRNKRWGQVLVGTAQRLKYLHESVGKLLQSVDFHRFKLISVLRAAECFCAGRSSGQAVTYAWEGWGGGSVGTC